MKFCTPREGNPGNVLLSRRTLQNICNTFFWLLHSFYWKSMETCFYLQNFAEIQNDFKEFGPIVNWMERRRAHCYVQAKKYMLLENFPNSWRRARAGGRYENLRVEYSFRGHNLPLVVIGLIDLPKSGPHPSPCRFHRPCLASAAHSPSQSCIA